MSNNYVNKTKKKTSYESSNLNSILNTFQLPFDLLLALWSFQVYVHINIPALACFYFEVKITVINYDTAPSET